MDSVIVKIMVVIVCISLVILLVSQVYINTKKQYKVETALSYSSATKESFYGIFVRDENLIRYGGSGCISYLLPDGSKTANGSAVADVYNSEDAIVTNSRIEKIESEIALLEAAQNPGTTEVAQPDFISSLISERYQNISTGIAKGDIPSVLADRDQFLSLMSIYQITIGEEINYNDRIDELSRELNTLRSKRQSPTREITVDKTGYFVSYSDGYENELSTENIGEIDKKRINEIISDSKTGRTNEVSGTIGKLIEGYEWKMIGIIDNYSHVYKPGDEVKLKFASTSNSVTAKIESITDTDNDHESIVCITCDELTFELAKNRVEHVDMILHDYEGIRVPRSALRFDRNNNKGVYVLVGQRVVFKKLDIIYENDDYLLSKMTSDPGYVSRYDSIILSGVNTAEFMSTLDEPEEEHDEEIPYYTAPEETEAPETEELPEESETEVSEDESEEE